MKLGLVLEGGATRAIFSAGVMDFLLDENIYADYVIGVSAGISNAMSYASRQKGRALAISEGYMHDPRYMGMKHLLNPKMRCYYNLDFVFGTVPNEIIPFDHDSYAASGIEAVAGVTNIHTGKAEYFTVNPYDNSWKTLIASCALPILFQPVEIDGSLYLDGGISAPLPIRRAIEDGCDKIIVITTRERNYSKTKETGIQLSSFLYRKYPNLVKLLKSRLDIYNNSRNELKELEAQGKVFWIAPSDTSTWGRTDSDPDKIRAMYEEGYNTAKKLFPDLLKYLHS